MYQSSFNSGGLTLGKDIVSLLEFVQWRVKVVSDVSMQTRQSV